MDKNLEKQLVEKYPTLFRDYGKSPQETCMSWGCEHDDGWYDLIDNLSSYLSAVSRDHMYIKVKESYTLTDEDYEKYKINKDYPRFKIPNPTIIYQQIKEKWGGLRVYVSITQDLGDELLAKLDEDDYDSQYDKAYSEIYSVVSYTEFLSKRVCEVCGSKGKTYYDGWWKTLCPLHAKLHKRSDEVTLKDLP
jgi:hypothetical protein